MAVRDFAVQELLLHRGMSLDPPETFKTPRTSAEGPVRRHLRRHPHRRLRGYGYRQLSLVTFLHRRVQLPLQLCVLVTIRLLVWTAHGDARQRIVDCEFCWVAGDGNGLNR